jgi:hypothetical protein
MKLKSSYLQVALHTNKEMTAFSTGHGLWQIRVKPCDPYNAPEMLKQLMESSPVL